MKHVFTPACWVQQPSHTRPPGRHGPVRGKRAVGPSPGLTEGPQPTLVGSQLCPQIIQKFRIHALGCEHGAPCHMTVEGRGLVGGGVGRGGGVSGGSDVKQGSGGCEV